MFRKLCSALKIFFKNFANLNFVNFQNPMKSNFEGSQLIKFWSSITFPGVMWGPTQKCWSDRFSRFDVYWIQTVIHKYNYAHVCRRLFRITIDNTYFKNSRWIKNFLKKLTDRKFIILFKIRNQYLTFVRFQYFEYV